MRYIKRIILLCVCMMLCSCGAAVPVMVSEAGTTSEPPQSSLLPETAEPESAAEESEAEPEEAEPEKPGIYVPEPGMSPEETVQAYFERQYMGYVMLENVDCRAIIDMTKQVNRRMLDWFSMLNQRRRLIAESGICYVDTEEKPYEIVFDEQPEDDRMDKWNDWMDLNGYTAVHFHIEGEKGEAYPPFMAVSSQHSIFLQEKDGVWKITMHYFPGALRKYLKTGTLEKTDDYMMLEQLAAEFDAQDPPEGEPAPSGFDIYDPNAAVEYALLYTEGKNPDFYDIGDWTGNCANFISQCVWAGFGKGHMDSQWWGGDSGTPAWENVNYLWSYITGGTGLRGEVFTGADSLRKGDIVQLRSLSDPDEDRYTHTMLVVDDEKLILAQNTPACFVYYSDLANIETRFIRPTYAVNAK